MNDPAILARQVGLLYRNIPVGQAISVINAGLLAWLWHAQVGPENALAWWVATVVAAGARAVVAQRYHADHQANARTDRWLGAALVGAGIAGLVWAGGALLFMLRANTVQVFFSAFVMAGMVAGAVPILAAHRLAFRLYAWPIALAVMAAAAGTDLLHLTFEVMVLLFILGSTRSADNFHDALLETFRLQLEKEYLAADLEKAKVRAEASDRAKSHFLANVSHELRTPMNGIMGMADLLAMESLSPEQQEFLTPLRQSADDLLQKIENMIELSAVEAGEIASEPVPFSFAELFESILCKYRQAAQAKGLAFTAREGPGLPPVVVGDVEVVCKIIHHVVDNAIKFTARGGVDIAVEVISQEGATVRIALTVRDSGPGIAAAQLETIFDLFTQVDGSTTRRHGGTGIGLSLSRRLAKAIGGSLTVDSKVGIGTSVRVDLPFDVSAC